jgi:hypothetical protein
VNTLRGAVDRWRWFWGKYDIVTMDAQSRLGSHGRPLNQREQSQARAIARLDHQAMQAAPRAERAQRRKLFMAADRARRDELRDWHRRVRSGRS